MDGEPVDAPADAASRIRAYVTLTKPGITAFILLVAVAGFFAASPYPPPWAHLGWLLVSGGAASAGAAALNHWYDRDIDAVMKRTRGRPLPTAQIPPSHVVAFGILLTALGWSLSLVTLGPLVMACIASGTLVYVVVYTIWLKRRTRWNIVIGGYAGSAPVLAGSAAALGVITPEAALLAFLVFLWTPPHFWSLAIALKDDFRSPHLPMLPNPGDLSRSGRTVVLSAALLLPVTLAFLLFRTDFLPFFVGGLILGVAFLMVTWPLRASTERKVAIRGFVMSGVYLLGIVGAMVLNWAVVRIPWLRG